MLWQAVHGWLETLLEAAAESYAGSLPRYVLNELRRYLGCGILACGFARAFCSACGASMLVAFSCKTRALCPSCGARRTSQTAANLVDRVLPDVPLRQWVLSAPFDLTIPMDRDAALLTAVPRIFCSEIERLLQRLGQERGVRRGATGQVAAIQLFGGSSNLNPHQHVLGLDGVYSTAVDGQHVVFTPTRAPAQSELLDVVQRMHKRVLRWVQRHGPGDDQDDSLDEQPSTAASCAQPSLRLGKLGYVDTDGLAHEADPDHARFGVRKGTPCSAEYHGWSLHAAVTIAAGDSEGRERLCRYALRHALSLERMCWTRDGRIGYLVKYPRSPSRTHLLLEPLQLLARLAALVAAPRHPLVRYVGVLSSPSKWREHVVPGLHRDGSCPHPKAHDQPPPPASDTAPAVRTTDASRTPMAAPQQPDPPSTDGKLSRGCPQAAGNYIDWHTLLARVYGIDSLKCPRCAGQLRMLAVITEPEPIRAILESMGLPSTPPVPARARYPTCSTTRSSRAATWRSSSRLRSLAPPRAVVRRARTRLSIVRHSAPPASCSRRRARTSGSTSARSPWIWSSATRKRASARLRRVTRRACLVRRPGG